MNNKLCVYLHKRNDNDEIFYIGIGIKNRPYSKHSRNRYWYHIVKKYGYSVEIIYDGLNWESACIIEIMLIEKYGRKDLGLGPLVNLTNGGDGTFGLKNPFLSSMNQKYPKKGEKNGMFGKKHNDDSKNRMKQSHSGVKNHFYGKSHTSESKNKISKSKKGKKGRSGEEHSQCRLTWDIVSEIRNTYIPKDKIYGLKPLSKKFEVSSSLIGQIIRNKRWIDDNYNPQKIDFTN
jgi:hypothetical protein